MGHGIIIVVVLTINDPTQWRMGEGAGQKGRGRGSMERAEVEGGIWDEGGRSWWREGVGRVG